MLVLLLLLIYTLHIYAQFDPDVYLASLVLRVGPGTEMYAPDVCPYLSTPQEEDNPELPPWDCPAGFFCLGPGHRAICPAGFYCPPNTAQPQYCCAGYYCPTPNVIKRCEANYYCPKGSVKPLSCYFLASCPAGTKYASRYGVLGLFFIILILVSLGFTLKNRSDRMKYAKDKEKLLYSFRRLYSPEQDANELGLVDATFRIKFDNISVTLPSGVHVLHAVSGELRPSRTCAIIGPSGSGKTTLLNALLGKIRRSGGTIHVNNKEEELTKYRKVTGCVPQEDVMLRELTIRDVLQHSALMRLPREMPHSVKKQTVSDTIKFLDLVNIMDVRIGDVDRRGISGGQRKRVNIGMELVMKPSILMLDEPTTGLDSSSALEICRMLRTAAKTQNLTVAAVVHAPSAESFAQFDDVVVLGKRGYAVYTGPIENAAKYFERLGFRKLDRNENLADYIISVVSGKVESCIGLAHSDLPLCWMRSSQAEEPVITGDDIEAMRELERTLLTPANASREQLTGASDVSIWKTTWIQISRFFHKFFIGIRTAAVETGYYLDDIFSEAFRWVAHMARFWVRDPIRSTVSEFREFQLCFKRACLQIYRSRRQFMFDLLLHLGGGAAISLVSRSFDYLGRQPADICRISPVILRPSCTIATENIAVIGVFMSLGVCFAGVSVGASTFGHERAVYWRDTSSGMDSFPYYLAKSTADLPRCFIATIFFSLSFIMFYSFHGSYFDIFGIIFLLYFTSFAMGYFISMIVRPATVGLLCTAFSLAWAIVFSGVVPDLADIRLLPAYQGVLWLWDVSAPRWAIEAFYIAEVSARPFEEIRNAPLPHNYKLTNYSSALINVVLIGLCWNVLAFMAMKLTYRSKQK